MADGAGATRDPETLPLGSMVADRYRLDRLLGTGGFGAVFAATASDTGRRVALKVLDNRVIDKLGGDARFAREAELARRLDHPKVVRVLDEGQGRDGTRYIAFELLEGRSVADELKRWGPMQAGKAAGITLDVLDALGAAHGHGIVHRDLKPANVFLLEGTDEVKVLDFGIAKSTNPGTLVGLTQEGMMLGTPMYMAVEQMTGAEVGPSTDLFAVGLLLLEMLLGRQPYPATITAMDLVRQRLAGQPVPIPEPIASSPFGPIIVRATHRDPGARYPVATVMAEDVRAALADPRFHDAVIASSMDSLSPSRAFSEAAFGPTLGTPALPPSSPPSPGYAASRPTPYSAPPPHPYTAAPPQPWGGPQPVAAPRGSGDTSLWLVAVAVVGLFAVMGAGIGFWAMSGASANTTPDEAVEIPAPPDRPERPPPPAPAPRTEDVAVESPAAEVRLMPCRGIRRLGRLALRRRMTAGGWDVTGTLAMCAGNLVNFRCDSGAGKGWTGTKNGQKGQAVVLRFSSPQAASTWVKEQSAERGDNTIAGPDGGAVLYLTMPAADADALTSKVCR